MTLLTPIALLLLVPWAVACVWGGRRTDISRRVPFLHLWPKSSTAVGPRRRVPPWPMILLLLAALFAILAAAGLAIRADVPGVTVVVDRRPSMTPGRLRDAVVRLKLPASTRVRVMPSVGEAYDAVGGIDPARLPPNALATDDDLRQTVRRATTLADGRSQAAAVPAPVVVLTDRPTDAPPGVVVVSPGQRLANAGIERFALTPVSPTRADALVRVFNGTGSRRATIDVNGVRQSITLPPPGESGDTFIRVPTPGPTAVATLLADDDRPWRDDVAGDDRAFLALVTSPGRIEPRTPLPEPLGRLIAVYARHRTQAVDAPVIAIVRGNPPSGLAVILADAFVEPRQKIDDAVTLDASHAVSRSLDPRSIALLPRSPAPPPGDGWRPLATAGDAVLLAVRDAPARQAWVGIDTDPLATDAAYVRLWADVFDWLAGGDRQWAAGPAGEPGEAIDVADRGLVASPGLYRGRSGEPVAPPAWPKSAEHDTGYSRANFTDFHGGSPASGVPIVRFARAAGGVAGRPAA